MFVVDVERNQLDVGRAHSEFFGDVLPASTMLGVAGFVGPEFLVEIEAEAIPRLTPGRTRPDRRWWLDSARAFGRSRRIRLGA